MVEAKIKRNGNLLFLIQFQLLQGGVGSLGEKTIKGKLIRGISSAALASGAMIGAGKLDEANNSGKLKDWEVTSV